MPLLVATFDEVQIAGTILVRRSESAPGWAWPDHVLPTTLGPFRSSIDGLDVEVTLKFNEPSTQSFNGQSFRELTGLLVTASRDEKVATSDVHAESVQLATDRSEAYRKVAAKAVLRLIRYCKYRLRIPVGPTYPIHLGNPRWTLDGALIVGAPQHLAGFSRSRDPDCLLNGDDDTVINNALTLDIEPRLHDELLADAISAWEDKALLRAVLEAAICCEVATKEMFFGTSVHVARATYNYIERSGRVPSVNQLITKVATEVFGRSFKEEHPSDQTAIDHLFRARNQAAHHGQLSFRDDGGKLISANKKLIWSWIRSTGVLLEWLAGLQRQLLSS